MSKKHVIFTAVLLLISFFVISNSIGKKDGPLEVFKKFIPENIKIKLKKTIFIFKNQKILEKEIAKSNQRIKDLRNEKTEILDSMGEIPNLIGHIPLTYTKEDKIKILDKNYKLRKFETSFLTIGK